MKSFSIVSGIFCLFLISACAHKEASPADQRTPAQSQLELPNPDEITIWSLQELARQKRYDILNELFVTRNLFLEQLPKGYAAGAAARVMDMPGKGADSGLELITGKSWRGKIFFPSSNPKKSRGLNRIRQGVVKSAGIVPMASFTTNVLESHSLTPGVRHIVDLNYANPVTKGYWQEKVLKLNTQVYDLMIPIQGKYGPVYIGKTWLGDYDKQGNFTARYPDNLIAWFFLDFNQAALDVQQAQYWDGSQETKLDPLPQVNE